MTDVKETNEVQTQKQDTPMVEDGKVVESSQEDTKMMQNDVKDSKSIAGKSDLDKNPNSEDVKERKDNTKTDRHWDHTDRKVIVDGVNKFSKPKQIDSMIKSWLDGHDGKIKIAKHKKPVKTNWILITLEHENMVNDFLAELNSGKHKSKNGKTLRAYRASERNNTKNKNQKRGASDDGDSSKKPRLQPEDCVKTVDEVRDSITPLWRLSYDEQLVAKSKKMSIKCLAKIMNEIKFKIRNLNKEAKRSNRSPVSPYKWMDSSRAIEANPIIGAPKQVEYRNKCELTFGYRHTVNGEDGKTIIKAPAVGFMAGGWSGGVSNPHCLPNIPDEVCGIADIVNEFLSSSPLPPYDSKSHRGVWRQLTMRLSKRTDECMLIITHAPASGGAGKKDDGSDDYTEQFKTEKDRLIKMLTETNIPSPVRDLPMQTSEGNTAKEEEMSAPKSKNVSKVTSLFFQSYDGLSSPTPDHPCQHAFGKFCLEEKLGQCTFQISPGAFFQVTTEGAEVLYDVIVKNIKEVSEQPSETLLFDVCCGTGTIGLTCMKEGAVGKIIGIDISESAIKDAMKNSEKNGYCGDDQARFIASRAELVMSDETRKVDCPMVAVVDPARDGLHGDVLRALRNKKKIKRIVYVSCNPTGSLIKDAAALCSPPTKKYFEAPFKITSAQPVDMFPYTSHCEMVMVFDRMTEDDLAEGDAK